MPRACGVLSEFQNDIHYYLYPPHYPFLRVVMGTSLCSAINYPWTSTHLDSLISPFKIFNHNGHDTCTSPVPDGKVLCSLCLNDSYDVDETPNINFALPRAWIPLVSLSRRLC